MIIRRVVGVLMQRGGRHTAAQPEHPLTPDHRGGSVVVDKLSVPSIVSGDEFLRMRRRKVAVCEQTGATRGASFIVGARRRGSGPRPDAEARTRESPPHSTPAGFRIARCLISRSKGGDMPDVRAEDGADVYHRPRFARVVLRASNPATSSSLAVYNDGAEPIRVRVSTFPPGVPSVFGGRNRNGLG